MIEQCATYKVHFTFAVDALESSHPISVEIDDPNKINELFNSISYDKGIHFTRHIIGKFIYWEYRNFRHSNAEQFSW